MTCAKKAVRLTTPFIFNSPQHRFWAASNKDLSDGRYATSSRT